MSEIYQAIRSLLKTRMLAGIIVTTLALGIGANTATFSVANTLLFKPMPYADASRLVFVWGNFLKLKIQHLPAKSAEYLDYREQHEAFSEVAAFQNRDYMLHSDRTPTRLIGTRVSEQLLALLGAKAQLGRLPLSQDYLPGQDQVVVLSDDLWRRQFNSSPSVVGTSIELDDKKYEIIGVAAPQFSFPHPAFSFTSPAEFWTPLTLDARQVAERAGGYQLNVIAKLKDGVTLEQAQGTLGTLAVRMEQNYRGYRGPKGEDGGWRISLISLQNEVSGSSRYSLLVLLGISALVLLVACANVANLLLLRASQRTREIAVRMALGASRIRIARQLIVESVILGLAGGAAGLFVAIWSLDVLIAISPNQLPRLNEVSLDWRVLAFATLISVVSGLACGLASALRQSHETLVEAMRDGTAGSGLQKGHLRTVLVGTQIAVAVCVVLAAALLIRSLMELQAVNPGLNSEGLLTFEIGVTESRYGDRVKVASFFHEATTRINAMPGVDGVGAGTVFPLSGNATDDPFSVEGRALDMNHLTLAGHQAVSSDFFRTLGIPLENGRYFTETDTLDSSPVAIVNHELAKRFFPKGDAIGQRIKLGAPMGPAPWTTIVGIVRDVPHRGLESSAEPDWYLPQAQAPARRVYFFVRTKLDPLSLAGSISRAISQIDPGQTILKPQTMNSAIGATLAPRRFNTVLAAIFAVVTLLLAGGGVYSVIAYSMQRRTREIGVRMALGARHRDVVKLALLEGSRPIAFGIICGLGLAMGLSRFLKSLLFGVTSTDPLTVCTIVLLMACLAALGCYLPARRASRIDPLAALRYE